VAPAIEGGENAKFLQIISEKNFVKKYKRKICWQTI